MRSLFNQLDPDGSGAIEYHELRMLIDKPQPLDKLSQAVMLG